MLNPNGRPPEKRAQHFSAGATNNTSFGIGASGLSGSGRVARDMIIGCSASKPKPGCGSSQARKFF